MYTPCQHQAGLPAKVTLILITQTPEKEGSFFYLSLTFRVEKNLSNIIKEFIIITLK